MGRNFHFPAGWTYLLTERPERSGLSPEFVADKFVLHKSLQRYASTHPLSVLITTFNGFSGECVRHCSQI